MKEHEDTIGELWQLEYHNKFECIIEIEKITSYEPDEDDEQSYFIRGIIVDCKETDNIKIGDSVLFCWRITQHLMRTQISSRVKRFLKLVENTPKCSQEKKDRKWWEWRR